MRIGGGGLRARRDGGGRRLGEEEWAVLQERSPSLAISYLDLTMCILGGCVCSRLKRVERKEPWAGWGKTPELTISFFSNFALNGKLESQVASSKILTLQLSSSTNYDYD